jgi:hypothetical protein
VVGRGSKPFGNGSLVERSSFQTRWSWVPIEAGRGSKRFGALVPWKQVRPSRSLNTVPLLKVRADFGRADFGVLRQYVELDSAEVGPQSDPGAQRHPADLCHRRYGDRVSRLCPKAFAWACFTLSRINRSGSRFQIHWKRVWVPNPLETGSVKEGRGFKSIGNGSPPWRRAPNHQLAPMQQHLQSTCLF